MIKKACALLTDPAARIKSLAVRGYYRRLSDEAYLRKAFKTIAGYDLCLETPRTFNEKLQWLKLHDRNPLYCTLADKYAVKEYVGRIIGAEHIIPTLGVWERFEDIDFDALPHRFVLKCTHNSGGTVLVKDKRRMDRKAAGRTIRRSLGRNYFYYGREWPYKNIKPRIIAEKLLTDGADDLPDYKILCFHGEPKVILVCRGRFSADGMTEDFYDVDLRHLPVKRPKCANPHRQIGCREEVNEMLALAKRLSEGLPFVRVDFYAALHQVYFGELTLYPASGFERFIPDSFDREMGQWLKLGPEKA